MSLTSSSFTDYRTSTPFATKASYVALPESTVTTSTQGSGYPSPSSSSIRNSAFDPNNSFWDGLDQGPKAGIVIAGIIGIVVIVLASMWCCCGRACCRRRRERRRQRDVDGESGAVGIRGGAGSTEGGQIPLRTIHDGERRHAPAAELAGLQQIPRAEMAGRQASVRGAPPRYEEIAPVAHQTLAGGVRNSVPPEEEAGMGVISDGKTPLSEIPYEDAMLEPVSSHSSQSREFQERHRMGGGNTRGHTNS